MPRKQVDKKAPTEGSRWRIVRGEVELYSFASPELARKRFFSLSRSVAGKGAVLLRPDGRQDDGGSD